MGEIGQVGFIGRWLDFGRVGQQGCPTYPVCPTNPTRPILKSKLSDGDGKLLLCGTILSMLNTRQYHQTCHLAKNQCRSSPDTSTRLAFCNSHECPLSVRRPTISQKPFDPTLCKNTSQSDLQNCYCPRKKCTSPIY